MLLTKLLNPFHFFFVVLLSKPLNPSHLSSSSSSIISQAHQAAVKKTAAPVAPAVAVAVAAAVAVAVASGCDCCLL